MTDVAQYFAPDYEAARDKFLTAAKALDLDVLSFENPCAQTPGGKPLTTDVVKLGRSDAPAKLILMSGTHGVEGFCGSGVQVAFLNRLSAFTIPDDVQVIIVHAINPYGFAWLRRVNEDNVDLNRNFVDHELAYPKNEAYEELKAEISPGDISEETFKAANAKMRAYSEKHGAPALQAAISTGQYSHPEGLYYGGAFATWSHKTFRQIVEDAAPGAKAIALIDFHTGLGPHGYGEPIIEFPPEDPSYIRARDWWGDNVMSTVSGDSVSPHLTGTIDGAMPDMAPEAEVTAMALEFGTVPSNRVFRALRKDNWLHLHGDLTSPEGMAIKQELRDAFYPDTDEWKGMVWTRSEEMIKGGLEGIARSVR